MSRKTIALFATALIVTTLLPSGVAAHAANSGVTVADAWVRASEYSDHVGGMTGIFARITNHTKHTVVLIGGTTSISSVVQTHQVLNGMMSEKPNGIAIKPGETKVLQPGGLHVMLMNLKRPIVPGNKVRFTFVFKGAKSKPVTLLAKVAQAGGESYTPSPTPTH